MNSGENLQTYSHARVPSVPQKVIHKLSVFYLNINTKLTNLGRVAAMTGIFTFFLKKKENLIQHFVFPIQSSG